MTDICGKKNLGTYFSIQNEILLNDIENNLL